MLKNICRICANGTDVTKATNLFDKSASKLLQEINLLTGVVLEATKDLPEVICNNCQNDLHSAIEFRKRCLSNHKRWTQHLKGVSESKSSPIPSSTLVTRVRRSVRTRLRCPSENESVDNTTLSPDELLIKVEHTNNDTEREDDFDHLDTESSSFNNDATENMSLLDDVDYVPMLTKTKRIRRLPQTTVKRQTRKQQLPVFFCDQCGRNVTGKSAFDRHLRKHSGIRPFQCEQCPARFLSAGELKGHQVSHTGVRNFPCRYCDRTYVNHSGRLRHERTHTNERPFVCVHCGKAFTNSYILKNHNLVHTGERLFRCDLCERSFSRPTHLKTHYRSNTHKQNVEKSYALEQRSTKKEELHSVSEIVMPQAANDPQAMIVVTVELPSEQ